MLWLSSLMQNVIGQTKPELTNQRNGLAELLIINPDIVAYTICMYIICALLFLYYVV